MKKKTKKSEKQERECCFINEKFLSFLYGIGCDFFFNYSVNIF
jgi:hypothetical protein